MPNLQSNLFLRMKIATYSSHGVKLQTHLWSQGYFYIALGKCCEMHRNVVT